MPLWNIQVYCQGELLSIDVIEEAEVTQLTHYFERSGYEVRAEPAWNPAHAIDENVEAEPRQVRTRPAAKVPLLKPKIQEK